MPWSFWPVEAHFWTKRIPRAPLRPSRDTRARKNRPGGDVAPRVRCIGSLCGRSCHYRKQRRPAQAQDTGRRCERSHHAGGTVPGRSKEPNYFAFTVITPCMIAKWPGKVQRKGYSPAAGAVKVMVSDSPPPSSLVWATTCSLDSASCGM